MNIVVSFEARRSISDITRAFQNHLSEKEIKRTVDWALNDTTRRVQGYIRREVRKEYTVSKVYLDKASRISRYANYNKGKQYTELSFDYKPVPFTAFKYRGSIRSKRPVVVTIKKGQPKEWRHAFVMKNATNKTNNLGIYAQGYYDNGKFVNQYGKKREKGGLANGKVKLTQLKGPSAFTMFTSRNMQGKIMTYVENRLPSQLKYLLQRKVDRMRNI